MAILNAKSDMLKNAEMIHVKSVDGQKVYSLQPSCWQCSKLILGTGIKYMWLYLESGLKRYTTEEFHRETLINCNLYITNGISQII